MTIEININGKKLFTRKRIVIFLIIIILLGTAVFLYADPLYLFTDGEVLYADDLNANFDKMPPVGAIIAWHEDMTGTPTLPDGWVECNGQTLSDSESLYNGQTIPDLNGEGRFLRGSDTSGTMQNDAFQGHTHSYDNPVSENTGGGYWGEVRVNTPISYRNREMEDTLSDGSHGTPRTASETRPINMSVVWIMRVK